MREFGMGRRWRTLVLLMVAAFGLLTPISGPRPLLQRSTTEAPRASDARGAPIEGKANAGVQSRGAGEVEPVSGSQGPAFRRIGSLSRWPADARRIFGAAFVTEQSEIERISFVKFLFDGTLLPIPERGLLLQLWQSEDSQDTAVAVRDLRTLQIKRSLKLPYRIQRAPVQRTGEWLHAIDPEGGRLFVLQSNQFNLIVIDLEDFSYKTLSISPRTPDGKPLPGVTVTGLTWDARARRLWSVWGRYASSLDPVSATMLVAMSPDRPDGAEAVAPPEGSKFPSGIRVLRGCKGTPPAANGPQMWYGAQMLRYGSRLYIPCHTDTGAGAIAVLEVASAFDQSQTEEIIPGPIEIVSSIVDEPAGRLHLITSTGEDWVFDAGLGGFVGVLALGPGKYQPGFALGLDRVSGRMYIRSGSFGLGFLEGRQTPVPQAVIFPERLPSKLAELYSQEVIAVDGARNRIFALPGSGGSIEGSRRALAYEIWGVPPAIALPPPRNPDANTIDIVERPGVTTASLSASSSGYGIRVRLAGGVAKVVPSLTTSNGSVGGSVWRTTRSKCGYTDREFAAGRVAEAKLASGSSRAVALNFSLDNSTQQNMLAPSQCDLESSFVPWKGVFGTLPADQSARVERAAAHEWKPGYARCSSPGTPPESSPGELPAGKAEATCPEADTAQPLVATAVGEVEGPVVTGSGYTTTVLYRDAERGVVSRTESRVTGLQIMGEAKIGEIRSVAESWAGGRPGTAASKRIITFSHFVGSDGTRCGSCDIDTVLTSLNAIFVGKAAFRKGAEPDPFLFRGSPGGAQSAVQKSDVQVASDQALTGDQSAEIPALEMTVSNDSYDWGRARQVYQFAGVKTAATYNISLLADMPIAAADRQYTPKPGLQISITQPESSGHGNLSLAPPPVGQDGLPSVPERVAGILLRSARAAARMGSAWLLFLSPLLVSGRRRRLRHLAQG